METKDIATKLELIHALKEQKAELQEQIDALEDSVKAEMDAQGISSLTIGKCTAKYTRYFSERFDSKAFRSAHEDLYVEYTKTVPASRFTVRVKDGD